MPENRLFPQPACHPDRDAPEPSLSQVLCRSLGCLFCEITVESLNKRNRTVDLICHRLTHTAQKSTLDLGAPKGPYNHQVNRILFAFKVSSGSFSSSTYWNNAATAYSRARSDRPSFCRSLIIIHAGYGSLILAINLPSSPSSQYTHQPVVAFMAGILVDWV